MNTDLIQALATETVDYSPPTWARSAELQEYTRLVIKECVDVILAGQVFGLTNPESPLQVYNRACQDSANELITHFGV
jgi:hypothetical protein